MLGIIERNLGVIMNELKVMMRMITVVVIGLGLLGVFNAVFNSIYGTKDNGYVYPKSKEIYPGNRERSLNN